MKNNFQIAELLKTANPQEKIINELCEAIKSGGGPTLKALADKIFHMACYIGSPSSVIPFLSAITTRGIKTQTRPGHSYENEGENLGKGHFRWDWKAQTLNNNDLAHLNRVLAGLGRAWHIWRNYSK